MAELESGLRCDYCGIVGHVEKDCRARWHKISGARFEVDGNVTPSRPIRRPFAVETVRRRTVNGVTITRKRREA